MIEKLEKENPESMEFVLLEQNFDVNNLPKSAEWLDIELFDNKKYELRSPSKWLEFYTDENGGKIKMKAQALLLNPDFEVLFWEDVEVLDYNEKTKKWMVENRQQEKCEVLRINLVFRSENKKIFTMRFINAYMDRIYRNSILKYTFYIKNIPTSDINAISAKSK